MGEVSGKIGAVVCLQYGASIWSAHFHRTREYQEQFLDIVLLPIAGRLSTHVE